MGSRAVSRWSAGRIGAGGWFSTGYVEVSELTLITKMEEGWNHLELGLGLGRECDGMMWYVMRIGDYDRLCYRERVQPGTATMSSKWAGNAMTRKNTKHPQE